MGLLGIKAHVGHHACTRWPTTINRKPWSARFAIFV